MKKLKFSKIISMLTVLAMVFSIAAFPAMANTIDVVTGNLVHDILPTRVEGSSQTKFNQNSPKMTDGDITTSYEWSGGPTATFKYDLGKDYILDSFELYEGTFNRGFSLSIQAESSTEATLIKEVAGTDMTAVSGIDATVYHSAHQFSGEKARYIIVSYPSKSSFIVNEIVIKGTLASQGGGAAGGGGGDSVVESVDVDFSLKEGGNILNGQLVTSISGTYEEGTAPVYDKDVPANNVQLATDGDMSTSHNGIGSQVFTVACGTKFSLDTFSIYLKEEASFNLYLGATADNANLVGEFTADEIKKVNGTTVAIATADLKGKTANALTIEFTAAADTDTFTYYEMKLTAEKKEVDLAKDNIAKGKTIASTYVTYKDYNYYYSNTPSATCQLATDGDLSVAHCGYGKSGNGKVMATIDLGDVYKLSEVAVYLDKTHQRIVNIYGGTESPHAQNKDLDAFIANQSLLGQMTAGAAQRITTTTDKDGVDLSVGTLSLDPDIAKARYITIQYEGNYGFYYHEITVKGVKDLPTKVVAFDAAENVAYQKTVTSIAAGRYWGTSGPASSRQWATDGVIIPTGDSANNYHRGNGKTNVGDLVGVSFYVDFEAEMKLTEFALYMPSNQPEREIKIYSGSAIDEEKLITTITTPKSTVIVNGDEVFELRAELNDVIASQLTVSYEGGSDFAYYEIYAKGEKNLEKKTIDFKATENIAYGKTVTPIKGSYYGSAPKPTETNQKATDGDIETYHSGYGKEGTTITGLEFSIDLGKEYKLSDIEIFLAKDQTNRVYTVYKGTSVDANNLIATSTAAGKTIFVNGKEVTPTHVAFTEDVTAQQLTFRYDSSSGFAYYEIYIKGTEVTTGGGEGGGETPGEPDEPETPTELEVEFKSKKNIAYDKVVTSVSCGQWFSSGNYAPSASNKSVTDGSLNTFLSADGDGESAPTEGVKYMIDLGEEFDLTTLTMYGLNKSTNVYAGALTADANDGFKLKDADGNVATPIGTIAAGTAQTVNGTEGVLVSTLDLTGTTARYLTFEYVDKWGYELKEIYIEKVYDPTDEIGLSDITSEKAEEITADLTLPTVLDNGATIVWKSSSPHIISADGKVTPQKEDAQVTLTAVMTMGGKEFTKQFKLTVLKKNTEFIAWTDYFNLDFVESERNSYVMTANDASGNEIDGYFTDSSNWEESFLNGGGYKVSNKGGASVLIPFEENIVIPSNSAATKLGFTIQLSEAQGDCRYWVRNESGGYYMGIYIAGTTIGFGPTSSYKDRHWYVRNVDYVNEKMSIEIIFKDGYAYPYVNGQPAVRDDDGTKCFKLTASGNVAYLEPNMTPKSTVFYNYYIANGIDPTGECNISALTEEDVDKITKDLTLMKTLKNGSTVTWESSNPAVIDPDGKVTRARYDEKVTLTACITYNNQPLYKSFDFIVTAANKDKLNLILEHNDFASSAPYYVMTVPTGSSGAVKNGKLTLARSTEGDFSAEKFFVSDMKTRPYIVKGDKIILEQHLALKGSLDGGAATVRNENGDTVATYGFEEDGGEYIFFVRANGKEETIPYSLGEELFVRFELSTSNSTVNVLVNNKVITETPIAIAADTGISSVKYEAGDGESGALTIDGVTFMLEGTDHDRLKVKLDIANLTVLDLTTQDPENIVSDLTFSAVSRFGSKFKYESSKPEVISNEGFVTRQLEDTLVGVKVTLIKGNNKEETEFTFKVRGANPDNLAIGQTAISGGAVSGYAEKNAVDGLMETVFKTSASEKYLTITFDKETMINKVILRETTNEDGSYNVKAFTIDTSSDGYKWETAFAGTTVGAEAEITFDQVSTKYVRYAVTDLEGNETGLSEFEVYYKPVSSVAAKLDLDAVTITPSDYVVNSDITLPTEGEYGSTITWQSSRPDIIDNSGKLVSRPSSSTVITLTVTVKNGDTVLTKKFTRSVTGTGGGSTGGSGGGGGRVTSSGVSNTAGNNVSKEETPVTPSYTVFADVAEDRWSYNYIKELKDAGIVSGDGENFHPANNVTREEFVKMLVLSLGLTVEGSASFSDVSADAWYAPYVAAAVKAGIVNGLSDTEFGVGRSISRQDMAVMTHRALEKLSLNVESGASHIFTDGDEIAGYAKNAVDILSGAGILSGDGGMFAPLDSLTREQAAKVLCMIRKEITE